MSISPTTPVQPHRVLIVGGGAGGLELATRLGRRMKSNSVEVVLVDASLTHVWKPLLHEVAAGSLDTGNNEIDYLAHARQHNFQFHLGVMEGLDRRLRQIWLKPIHDEAGALIAERRALRYDTLVMAVGSQVNDFHTPGVCENALMLNTFEDARRLHKRLFAACLQLNEGMPAKTDIAIIGGGATGVELAAELRDALAQYASYTHSTAPLQARITLVEASDKILGNLPEAVREKVTQGLQDKDIQVLTGKRVEAVNPQALQIAGGESIPAQLIIWAAGVKAPSWLTQLDGLECNKLNQLQVTPTLQCTKDNHIFAFGDCASCMLPGRDKPLAPLAQAAHQQARYLAEVLPLHIQGHKLLPNFTFRDQGALIALGTDKAVGTLVGRISGHRFFVQGMLARLSYWTLYRGYLVALHGWLRMVLTTMGDWLMHSTKSRVKLH